MSGGRIYFVQAESGGPIKIGFARDVAARLKSIQTSHPEPLRCLVHIAGTMEEEQLLHKDHARFRLKGEWFKDCEAIQNLVAQARNNESADTLPEPQARPAPPPRKPRERVLEGAYHKLFVSYAECCFGRAGLKRKLAEAANINEKTAENWLAGKSDPSFEGATTLYRNAPLMFAWCMSTVVGSKISEQIGCGDLDAIGLIGEYADYLEPLFLHPRKERTATAINLLWDMHCQGERAEYWAFLTDYRREAYEFYQETRAAA